MNVTSFIWVDASEGLEHTYTTLMEKIETMQEAPRWIWISGSHRLPSVASLYAAGNQEAALQAFIDFKTSWFALAEQLLSNRQTEIFQQVKDLFTEVEWLLHDAPILSSTYYNDQIVPIETLALTRLLSSILAERGIMNHWQDARDAIRTDDSFGEAQIDMEHTATLFKALKRTTHTIILQAGIGSSDENETTQWRISEAQLTTFMSM
jgi:aspartate kinase